MNEILFPPGICGELAKCILKNARIEIPRFAIATALSIVATVAQRRYRSPIENGVLGSYQILVGSIGCGKTQYIDQFNRIIDLVDESLIMFHPSCVDALKRMLCENAGNTMVVDHGESWLQSFFNPRRKKAQKISVEFVNTWNNEQDNVLSIIAAVNDICYKNIFNIPSIFLYESFLSRIDFVFEKAGILNFETNDEPLEIPEHIVELLKDIAKSDTLRVVAWEPNVSEAWDEFARQFFERINDKNVLKFAHIAQKVLRTASLLAVVANPAQPVITLNELQWAIAWHESLVS